MCLHAWHYKVHLSSPEDLWRALFAYLRECRCVQLCVYVSVLFALNHSPLPTCPVKLRSQKVLSRLAPCPALGGALPADLAWMQKCNLSHPHPTQPNQTVFLQTKMDLFSAYTFPYSIHLFTFPVHFGVPSMSSVSALCPHYSCFLFVPLAFPYMHLSYHVPHFSIVVFVHS